jgi:mono/diheme cytochrome c family protein
MKMNRVFVRSIAVLTTLPLLFVGSAGYAQRNGEAHATVPTVDRTAYDMRTFTAPLPLNEAELAGRTLFAQRCANCHGGSAQRPGPPIGKPTVERLGDAAIREKIGKGSTLMPGFEHSLDAGQVGQIIAFLKTFTPRSQAAAPD